MGEVLGIANPERVVFTAAGALADPNVSKAAILGLVNQYNLEQTANGNDDDLIQGQWAQDHPLEALKIIIDYENKKKENAACPVK